MVKMYRCEKCGKDSSAESWNEATEQELIDVWDKSGEHTSIQDIELGNEEECYYFICPFCSETCFNEDGHITEVIYK